MIYDKPQQILLNPYAISRVLAAIAVGLILASTAGQLAAHLMGYERDDRLIRYFYIDAERNIPTAFSALLLIFGSLVTALVASVKWSQGAPFIWHWSVLSVGFLMMACDEALSFHERLIPPMRELLGGDNLGILYFAWVVPGIALVLVLMMFYLPFLLHLGSKVRSAFILAAALYLGGAIGLELIGGQFAELHGMRSLTYSMIVTVEETLEMSGAIMFIWAALTYTGNEFPNLQIRFAGAHR